MLVHAFLGYGLLQALVLVRLLPWIRQEPFAASYWAFTFGATALAVAPLRMIERGDSGAIAALAPLIFVAANVVVGLVAIGTIALLVSMAAGGQISGVSGRGGGSALAASLTSGGQTSARSGAIAPRAAPSPQAIPRR